MQTQTLNLHSLYESALPLQPSSPGYAAMLQDAQGNVLVIYLDSNGRLAAKTSCGPYALPLDAAAKLVCGPP